MNSSAVRALALEYKSLNEDPVEGFRVALINDENLFEWSVSCAENRGKLKHFENPRISGKSTEICASVTHESFSRP